MSEPTVTENSPGVTDVPGFSAAAAACGIRATGDRDRLDLALIYSKDPCSAAGVFTQNAVKAPPVRLCADLLAAGQPFHGIVANSGNANACTGEEGMADAREMGALTGNALGVPPNSFLVCSTGRIGDRLPMEKLRNGISVATTNLSSDQDRGLAAAQAILTSDTRPKTVTVRFEWEGQTVTEAGLAKGAGMIQPNMATMLAFLATDAAVEREVLQKILGRAVDYTFNRITVDGDMSTNDTVLLLANGRSGVRVADESGGLAERFAVAVRRACGYLAEKIVSDGEKITKVVEVIVAGAESEADAEKVARAIGNSLLVKSSWYGEDPNWGRLADAAGYAGARLVEEKLDIFYEDVPAVAKGRPLPENKPKWKEVVKAPRFRITLNLNLGRDEFRLLATDLTEAYVRFNKSE